MFCVDDASVTWAGAPRVDFDPVLPTSLAAAPVPGWIHYLPLLTTALAAGFVVELVRRRSRRAGGTHLSWWAFGVFCYGLGTALESAVTLAGNTVWLNKAWYVAGAVLGGYPLAQGSVYLLASRPTARALTWISLPVVLVVATLVLLSPVHLAALEPHRPTGAILQWSWVRACTPLVNGYAAVFLIGGAIYSAVRDARTGRRGRTAGNIWIAVGALLPGIGGGMAKAGVVEALYVGELVGLVFIWIGHRLCVGTERAGAR